MKERDWLEKQAREHASLIASTPCESDIMSAPDETLKQWLRAIRKVRRAKVPRRKTAWEIDGKIPVWIKENLKVRLWMRVDAVMPLPKGWRHHGYIGVEFTPQAGRVMYGREPSLFDYRLTFCSPRDRFSKKYKPQSDWRPLPFDFSKLSSRTFEQLLSVLIGQQAPSWLVKIKREQARWGKGSSVSLETVGRSARVGQIAWMLNEDDDRPYYKKGPRTELRLQ